VLIEEPVPLVYAASGAVDTRATVQAIVGVLERVITAHPEQWLVFAPVWRDGGNAGRPRARRGSHGEAK
jgi:KDO2-lipid IV(A) lauroyltransferase